MRHRHPSLKQLCVTAACAAVLLPSVATAASYQHRVSLRGLVVNSPGPALDSLSVALATSQLPDAIMGVPYSVNLNQLLTVTGDASYSGGGITWGVVSSSLPEGLYLTADGYIGGTPTATGTGDIQVRASYKTAQGEQTYQVVSLPLTVALSWAALPAATVGSPYSYDFKSLVSSNDPTFTGAQASFSATGLPSGLSLAVDGMISGVPTVKNEAGASFQVLASYKTQTGQQAYTIVVNGAVLQVTQFAAGFGHTCAVTVSGGLKCWGLDNFGQLGDGTELADKSTPVDVVGLTSGVASVTAGIYHTCALTTSGGVKCWGYDSYGQLGNDSSFTNKATPVDVSNMANGIKQVDAGGFHNCAVTNSGGLKCWGEDAYGQLGNDTSLTKQGVPVPVAGLATGVRQVSAGGNFTCAVTTSGGLKCWGIDMYGQLGDGSALVNKPTPVDVAGLTSGVASVSAAVGSHACAITTSGGLKCWGYDAYGQLGDDASLTNKATPTDVYGLTSGVAQVEGGAIYTCALTVSGGVFCWGDDTSGQLGNDTAFTNKPIPVPVLGLSSGVVKIAAGHAHACAVTTSGALKCWGYGSNGQLGNDAALTNQPTPVDVAP